MIILEHNNPKFVVDKDIRMLTDKGIVLEFSEEEPISLHKSEDGKRIYLGDEGDICEIYNPQDIQSFLSAISAASFELVEVEVNEFDGFEGLKPILLEGKFSNDDKLVRISLASEEIVSNKKVLINKVAVD